MKLEYVKDLEGRNMNTLMIVLMSILGIALFITVARIIDVLIRWYFAMNRHIELLSNFKSELQALKVMEAQAENRTDGKHNGNEKVIETVPVLSRAETKAAIENSLAALESLGSPPKIWRPMEIEYESRRLWFPQEEN